MNAIWVNLNEAAILINISLKNLHFAIECQYQVKFSIKSFEQLIKRLSFTWYMTIKIGVGN